MSRMWRAGVLAFSFVGLLGCGADGGELANTPELGVKLQAAATKAPPKVSSFTAQPSTIESGQSTTLSWVVADATSLSLTPNVGTVSGSSVTVRPSVTTTYTLTAKSRVGTTTATMTVTVSDPPPPPPPPPAGSWAALTWAHELPENYDSDVYRWMDSGQKQRTAVLTRNDTPDPGGSHGGMLRQFRFYVGEQERVATGTGANARWNGWGYVVNHHDNTSTSTADHAGSYRQVFVGRHHALHEFSWNISINGIPVKSTVHWFFSTGRDHPLYAITFDSSAAGSVGMPVDVDSRAPYGDIAWDGDGTGALVDGVKWGDKYKFSSLDEPLTAQSRWDYTQPNVVPYAMAFSRIADAEMGSVQTLGWQQHNTGGSWFHDNWGHISENRVDTGGFGSWRMPANWNWPYQLCQYSMDDTQPTSSKRLAWGLMYGAVGKLTYPGYGYERQYSGHSFQSYSVFMIMGRQSNGEVLAQVSQVEQLLQARLSVVRGQVVSEGLGGVGRTDTVTYPVAGYNATYGAHELRADAMGHFTLTLDAVGGDVRNPLFLVRGMTGVPGGLTLDGMALVADQDYFASFDASTGTVWLTLNRLWSGSHTLATSSSAQTL